MTPRRGSHAYVLKSRESRGKPRERDRTHRIADQAAPDTFCRYRRGRPEGHRPAIPTAPVRGGGGGPQKKSGEPQGRGPPPRHWFCPPPPPPSPPLSPPPKFLP